MTNTNLLHAMGRIDPKLIADAAPDVEQKKPANKTWVKWASIAACFVLILSAVIVVPMLREDINRYESYMTVYGDNSTLAFLDSIFTKSGAFPDGDEPYVNYVDESALQKKTETIFGSEFDLVYEKTRTLKGEVLDYYESTDGRYQVRYKKTTGEIRAIYNIQEAEKLPEELCYTEDELIDIAISFAKSKWAVFQDNCYVTGAEERESHGDLLVSIFRTIESNNITITTSEVVSVMVSLSGEVVGWDDCLKYPNGIPDDMLKAALEVDLDLCRSSVEHYIEECARDASIKNIEILRFGKGTFHIAHNGTLSWKISVFISDDGKGEEKHSFYVIIPY